MIRHIERLREKPLHIRKLILYTSVPLLTFLIASLWFLSLGAKPNQKEVISVGEVAPKEIFTEDTKKVFGSFNTNFFKEKIGSFFAK